MSPASLSPTRISAGSAAPPRSCGRRSATSALSGELAGSAAVLARPHIGRCGTINDLDGMVANFWRAVRSQPDAVADACDWPVIEADLHARHLWLIRTARAHHAADRRPGWCDPKVAGGGLGCVRGSAMGGATRGRAASPRTSATRRGASSVAAPAPRRRGRGVHAPRRAALADDAVAFGSTGGGYALSPIDCAPCGRVGRLAARGRQPNVFPAGGAMRPTAAASSSIRRTSTGAWITPRAGRAPTSPRRSVGGAWSTATTSACGWCSQATRANTRWSPSAGAWSIGRRRRLRLGGRRQRRPEARERLWLSRTASTPRGGPPSSRGCLMPLYPSSGSCARRLPRDRGRRRFGADAGAHGLPPYRPARDDVRRLDQARRRRRVGDLLMGPDSRAPGGSQPLPRRGAMVRVTPKRGASFVVNRPRPHPGADADERQPRRRSGRRFQCATGSHGIARRSTSWLFRVGADFPVSPTAAPLPLDPYFLGLLLDDGSMSQGGVSVCKPDVEVREECFAQAAAHGLSIRTQDEALRPWRGVFGGRERSEAQQPVTNHLRSLGLMGTTSPHFIPRVYLVASRRMTGSAAARGLLDSDGHQSHSGFDWISASGASPKRRPSSPAASGSPRRSGLPEARPAQPAAYWRLSISGDCDIIPTRIPRKQAAARARRRTRCAPASGIERLAGPESFTVSRSRVTGATCRDFLVTHNSGKTSNSSSGLHPSVDRPGAALRLRGAPRRADRRHGPTHSRVRHPLRRREGGRAADPSAPVQVCSTQTLAPMLARGEAGAAGGPIHP